MLLSITIADSTAIDPQGGIGASGNGWVAIVVLGGITNTAGTLDASKLTLTVQDPGFLANGAVTTVSRTITSQDVLHRTHPNGDERLITTDGTNLTLYISLDDWVYSGTTIVTAGIAAGFYTGSTAGSVTATNSSTLAYKKPFGSWLNFNGDTETSNSVYVEFDASADTARNGQQIACAEFYVTDGVTQSASVFSNTTSISTLVTQGFPPECHSATLDMSGQTQGGFSKVNAKLYPWIGDASAIMDLDADGAAWPTALPHTPLRVFCDRTGAYGGAFAYVDGVGAGTPAVSSNPAIAKTTPYSTLAAAFTAVRAWNNTNKGHNDFGGATIRFINDSGSLVTYPIGVASGNFAGTGRCIVEADPLANAEIELEATVQVSLASNTMWRGLTYKTGASSYLHLGYSMSGTPSTTVYFSNMTLDNTLNKNGIGWHSYRYFRNLTLTGGNAINFGVGGLGPTDKAIPLFVGVVSADRDSHPAETTTIWPQAIIGCDLPDYSVSNTATTAGNDGRIIKNNRLRQLSLNSATLNTVNVGVANIQNVYEYKTGVSVICMNAYADGDLTTITNYIDYHNTAVGERCSRMYNDAVATKIAPNGMQKRGVSKYSIYDNYNIKDDRFNLGDGSGSVGNWAYSYSVGNVGNVSLFGNTRRDAGELPENTSADQYLGSHWLSSSEPNLLAEGYTQTQLMDQFVNWTTTPRAVPAVGGDYHLTATATEMLNRVPTGMAVLSFDLDGVARSNSGTGAAGAYEFTMAAPVLGWKTSVPNTLLDSTGTLLTSTTIDRAVFRTAWDSSDAILETSTTVAVDASGLVSYESSNLGALGDNFDVMMEDGDNFWLIKNQTVTDLEA